MIQRLMAGEMSVRELSAPFSISAPAISKHLTVLERAGLLSRRRVGREKQCRLAMAPLKEAAEWMASHEQFWSGQLDAFEAYLKTQSPPEATESNSEEPES